MLEPQNPFSVQHGKNPASISHAKAPLSTWSRVNTGATKLELSLQAQSGAVLGHLRSKVGPGAFRLAETLLEAALAKAVHEGYNPGVTTVVFHCPLEVVMAELGIKHRLTAQRYRAELEAADFLASHYHQGQQFTITKPDGSQVSYHQRTGTLWAVSLRPTRKARLTREDYSHKWRDMAADRRVGRLASRPPTSSEHKLIGQLNQNTEKRIKTWALSTVNTTPVNTNVHSSPGDWRNTVLDVFYCPRERAAQLIKAAVGTILQKLGDSTRNYSFWAWVLSRLRYLHERGQDYSQVLLDMLARAATDGLEGFARSPGALLISRLKKSPLWDLLKSTPHYLGGA